MGLKGRSESHMNQSEEKYGWITKSDFMEWALWSFERLKIYEEQGKENHTWLTHHDSKELFMRS